MCGSVCPPRYLSLLSKCTRTNAASSRCNRRTPASSFRRCPFISIPKQGKIINIVGYEIHGPQFANLMGNCNSFKERCTSIQNTHSVVQMSVVQTIGLHLPYDPYGKCPLIVELRTVVSMFLLSVYSLVVEKLCL